MPHKQKDILYLIKNLSSKETILEMLLEFEKTMDQAGVFAYRNWELGELVEGPEVDRYWFVTKWMYPLKLMPDPDGGLRLLKYGCKVAYQKDQFIEVSRVLGPEDIEPDSDQPRKARSRTLPVWIVTISMPRKFVDDSHEGVFELGGEEIDISDIHAAWDDGIDQSQENEEPADTDTPDDEFDTGEF